MNRESSEKYSVNKIVAYLLASRRFSTSKMISDDVCFFGDDSSSVSVLISSASSSNGTFWPARHFTGVSTPCCWRSKTTQSSPSSDRSPDVEASPFMALTMPARLPFLTSVVYLCRTWLQIPPMHSTRPITFTADNRSPFNSTAKTSWPISCK